MAGKMKRRQITVIAEVDDPESGAMKVAQSALRMSPMLRGFYAKQREHPKQPMPERRST